jgi:uncharacterized LabA/DUF88 family protein
MCEEGKREQVALLIDVANCRNLDLKQMLDVAQQQGELVVVRAYGNYANGRDLSEAAQELFLHGVQLIHCPAWRNGSGGWKSTADETLMNDACRLLFTERRVTTFMIASGDGHFVPTIREIKKRGKKAIVITGRSQASIPLRQTSDECILVPPVAAPVPEAIFQALVKAVRQLQKAQSRNAVYPSCLKQKMIELLGEFDHTQYRDRKNRPFKKFIDFLREAQSRGWIRLLRQGNDFLITAVSEYSQAA